MPMCKDISSDVMPFQWKDIVRDWLLGETLDYEIDDVVNAFDDVERILGQEWLRLTFGQVRGTAVAVQIIELGRILRAIEGNERVENLISKLRVYDSQAIFPRNERGRPNLLKFHQSDRIKESAHALAVGRCVAHYRRHSLEVELEPGLNVKDKRKHPDFRVRCHGVWIYVEVVCPSLSEEALNIYEILNRIANLDSKIRMNRVVEVYLFRDPSDTEINQIIEKCRKLAESDVQQQECILGDLAQIFISPWNQERLPTFFPAVEEKRPVFVVITFDLRNQRKCVAKMPFSDERAQLILSDKSRQLSPEYPGLIIMDVSGVPGALKRWPDLIAKRLRPDLNRRISGVLVTESLISGKSMKTEKRFIEHPNPIHPLPQDFITITASSAN
jgi:hypothetical protein